MQFSRRQRELRRIELQMAANRASAILDVLEEKWELGQDLQLKDFFDPSTTSITGLKSDVAAYERFLAQNPDLNPNNPNSFNNPNNDNN